ncbi:MAG: hypothetical protein HYV76_03120 [Candidatus Vogelbacteria bacterium]|nr:hypothetical protein [Candidatus Vogelbacteria bacterium]
MKNVNFKRGVSWPIVAIVVVIIALALAWWYSRSLNTAVESNVSDYQTTGQTAISDEFGGN